MDSACRMDSAASPEGACRRFSCARQTLGRRQRLRRNGEFQEAYRQDRRFHARTMVLFVREAEDAALRLGVVASKKVGNAPERARAKRRLRVVFRQSRALLPAHVDVVLVARRSILTAPFPQVREDFLFLVEKAGLLVRKAGGA